MLKLDNNLLDELGLGSLPEDQKRAMLQHIYETLELRVGTNLANQMTDQQLAEFEKFIDEGGDANQEQALQWLESNLPNYKQVVNDVFEALKGEIRQMAPQLVAASQQPAVAPPTYQQDPYVTPQPQPQQYGQAPSAQPDAAYQPGPAPQMPPQAPQAPYQPAPGFDQSQQQIPPAGGYQPAPQSFQPPQPPYPPQNPS